MLLNGSEWAWPAHTWWEGIIPEGRDHGSHQRAAYHGLFHRNSSLFFKWVSGLNFTLLITDSRAWNPFLIWVNTPSKGHHLKGNSVNESSESFLSSIHSVKLARAKFVFLTLNFFLVGWDWWHPPLRIIGQMKRRKPHRKSQKMVGSFKWKFSYTHHFYKGGIASGASHVGLCICIELQQSTVYQSSLDFHQQWNLSYFEKILWVRNVWFEMSFWIMPYFNLKTVCES